MEDGVVFVEWGVKMSLHPPITQRAGIEAIRTRLLAACREVNPGIIETDNEVCLEYSAGTPLDGWDESLADTTSEYDAEDVLRELVLALDANMRASGINGGLSQDVLDAHAKASHFLNIP